MLAMLRNALVLVVTLAVVALDAGALPGEAVAQSKAPDGVEQPAPAPLRRCRIGRRFYCHKYQGICTRDGSANCSAWFQACWQCHDDADACRRAGGECEDCRKQWSQCMSASYKAHWPAKARQ